MERVLRVGALNIVTQPHSQKTYYELIRKAYQRKKAAQCRGDRYAMLNFTSKLDKPSARGAFVQGAIGSFTQINVDAAWIDVSTGEKASGDDIALINIPPNLRPNMQLHHYRFYLKEHLLVFEIGNSGVRLTPKIAGRLFRGLFADPPIVKKFGEVAVTVMPRLGAVEDIINSTHVRELLLVIHAPNPPDDGESMQEKYTRRLESRRARKLEERWVAKSEQSLSLDPELKEATVVASENGFAQARIRQGNRTSIVSTVDMPYQFDYTYDDAGTLEFTAFEDAAAIVRQQLARE